MRDRPRYGYGTQRRPLETERDFVAHLIRRTLCLGGHRECQDWPTQLGFAVEGGGEPDRPADFRIAHAGDDTGDQLERYRLTLARAGWPVRYQRPNVLAIDGTQPLNSPPWWLRLQWRRQHSYGGTT